MLKILEKIAIGIGAIFMGILFYVLATSASCESKGVDLWDRPCEVQK